MQFKSKGCHVKEFYFEIGSILLFKKWARLLSIDEFEPSNFGSLLFATCIKNTEIASPYTSL